MDRVRQDMGLAPDVPDLQETARYEGIESGHVLEDVRCSYSGCIGLVSIPRVDDHFLPKVTGEVPAQKSQWM